MPTPRLTQVQEPSSASQEMRGPQPSVPQSSGWQKEPSAPPHSPVSHSSSWAQTAQIARLVCGQLQPPWGEQPTVPQSDEGAVQPTATSQKPRPLPSTLLQ